MLSDTFTDNNPRPCGPAESHCFALGCSVAGCVAADALGLGAALLVLLACGASVGGWSLEWEEKDQSCDSGDLWSRIFMS